MRELQNMTLATSQLSQKLSPITPLWVIGLPFMISWVRSKNLKRDLTWTSRCVLLAYLKLRSMSTAKTKWIWSKLRSVRFSSPVTLSNDKVKACCGRNWTRKQSLIRLQIVNAHKKQQISKMRPLSLKLPQFKQICKVKSNRHSMKALKTCTRRWNRSVMAISKSDFLCVRRYFSTLKSQKHKYHKCFKSELNIY